MATCYDNGTYGAGSENAEFGATKSVLGWGSDGALDVYADQLGSGDSCETVKAVFDNDVGAGETYIDVGYNQPGLALPKPTEGDTGWVDPATAFDNANYGFSVAVTEYIQTGSSSFTAVFRGTLDICSLIEEEPTCVEDPENPGFVRPNPIHVVHIDDNFSGSWPIVLGAPDTLGATAGWSVSITDYQGSRTGYTNANYCCDGDPPGPHDCQSYDGATFIRPDGMHLEFTTAPLTGFTDTETMWCCVSAVYACCGGGLIPTTNPHFVIPTPESPTPVEEHISSPTLESLIKVSNHTYQFINNFGRIKK